MIIILDEFIHIINKIVGVKMLVGKLVWKINEGGAAWVVIMAEGMDVVRMNK